MILYFGCKSSHYFYIFANSNKVKTMKKKKNQENRESMVCEPVVGYNRPPARHPNPITTPDVADADGLMSVDEYFDRLWSVVEAKYEKLQS
jgi:hypothetical protein